MRRCCPLFAPLSPSLACSSVGGLGAGVVAGLSFGFPSGGIGQLVLALFPVATSKCSESQFVGARPPFS
eukprot:13317807-Heterocapsa_arctica.AAC.1